MYTLEKIQKIVLAEPSEIVAGAISALEEGKFTKIICGAANTNKRHVERLAMVYALSGANALDISPSQEIISSAKSGIEKALDAYINNPEKFPCYKEPVLMISLDSGNDLHFRKAEINYERCINCFECIDSCPSKALYSDNNLLIFNKNNCYGCGRCAENCQQNAVNLEKFCTSPETNFEDIKAIEIHTGNNSIEEVKKYLELNVSLLKNVELLSFCVESKRFGSNEMQDYVNSLTSLVSRKAIIQIDGIPMGATVEPFSSLQTISASAVLLKGKTDAYIQLSGGTNHLTKKLVNRLGLKISGIGYGTFARKIILSFIEELDDNDFIRQLQRIVNIATSLVMN